MKSSSKYCDHKIEIVKLSSRLWIDDTSADQEGRGDLIIIIIIIIEEPK